MNKFFLFNHFICFLFMLSSCTPTDDEIIRRAKMYNAESDASIAIDVFVSTHHRMPDNKTQVVEFLDSWIAECPEEFPDDHGQRLKRYFEDSRTRLICFSDSCFLYSPIKLKNGYALYGLPKDWLESWYQQGRLTDFLPNYTDVFFRKDHTPILSMLQFGGSSPYLAFRQLYNQYPHRLYVRGQDNNYRICAVLMSYNRGEGLTFYSTLPNPLFRLSESEQFVPVRLDDLPNFKQYLYELEQDVSGKIDSLEEAESAIFYCPLCY